MSESHSHQCQCCTGKKKLSKYYFNTILRNQKHFIGDIDNINSKIFQNTLQLIYILEPFRNCIEDFKCDQESKVLFELKSLFSEFSDHQLSLSIEQFLKKIDDQLMFFSSFSELEIINEILTILSSSNPENYKKHINLSPKIKLKLENNSLLKAKPKKLGFFISIPALLLVEKVSNSFHLFFHMRSLLGLSQSSKLLHHSNSFSKKITPYFLSAIEASVPSDYKRPDIIPELILNLKGNLLFFYIDWEGVNPTANKILQVLISIQGVLCLDESSQKYGLKAILIHSLESCYYLVNDQQIWYTLLNNQIHVLGQGTWYDVVSYVFLGPHRPVCLFYQKDYQTDSVLSDKKIFLLEKLSYIGILNEKTGRLDGHFHEIIEPDKTAVEDVVIVHCNNCRAHKCEGLVCEICNYNESEWTCKNSHSNNAYALTCDFCEDSRCYIPNTLFPCKNCDSFTPGQKYCTFCSVFTCYSCSRKILSGRSVYYIESKSFTTAIPSCQHASHAKVLCAECAPSFIDI